MEFIADGKVIYRYVMPAIESNMYVLPEDGQALIIDPHISGEARTLLERHAVRQATVLLTHEHYDHISGMNWLREFCAVEAVCSAPCARALSDPDRNMARFWKVLIMDKPPSVQKEGMKLENTEYRCAADRTYETETAFIWQGHQIRMRQAPGHSPGGSLICVDETVLFSGDNLVNGAGVICRFPGGSKKEYAGVTRPALEALPDDLYVLPGHGDPAKLGELRVYLNHFARFDAIGGIIGGAEDDIGDLLRGRTWERGR